MARYHGATVLDHCGVKAIQPFEGGVDVETEAGTFSCRRLVVTAGAWTDRVLAAVGLNLSLTVTQEQVTYYATPNLPEFAIGRFPVFIRHGADTFYGFPIYGEVGTKIGIDASGPAVTVDTRTYEADTAREQRAETWLKETIPGFLGPKIYTKTCLYTMPKDRDFVIDTVPEHPQIIVCVGAGHAYKFAGLLGKIFSQMAIDGETEYPIAPFALNRPAITNPDFEPLFHTKNTRRRVNRGVERRRDRTQLALLKMPFLQLKNRLAPLNILSAEQVEQIHEASMHILENVGLRWLDEETLDLWEQAGAKVDRPRQHVWLDRALVMELVDQAPSTFTWRARNPKHNLIVGQNAINFLPTAGPVYAANQDIGRRPGVAEDYENLQKLSQMCNSLHAAGLGLVDLNDVPVSARHLQRQLMGYTLTDKANWAYLHGRLMCEDHLNMAKLVFGDDLTTGGPVTGGVVNVNSPLVYDKRMLGGLITMARAGQFVIVTPFVLAGAMSPVTLAAAAAQQNAEALAGLALTQLVRPGAPAVYGAFLTNVDMKSGGPSFGSPEGAIAIGIGAQMARRYNLPHRGSGALTSSNITDVQAAVESAWTLWPTVLAHTNLILHAAGWVESGLTISYEKFIIDVENLAMMHKFLQGIEISETTLALDSIAEIGPGGHHFGTLHTQSRFETAFYNPFLAERRNYGAWQEAGSFDMVQRAHKVWRQLLEQYEAPPLDVTIQEALEDYVDRREEELATVDLYSDG
jgi:trimethylamine--corrinoid protein Co-methyltransferase